MKNRHLLPIDRAQILQEKERVFAPLQREGGYSWREYEDVIRQIMNYYVGYLRSQKGMALALHKLDRLDDHLGEVKATNFHELLRANELMHLLKYCQLAVSACMERKESGRNCYIRSDYPHMDPSWDDKEIVQWQEGGEPRIDIQRIGE